MNDETPYMLNLEMIQEYVSSLKTLFSSSSFIEQKSFLRSFVKRIELNEPRIVIDYTNAYKWVNHYRGSSVYELPAKLGLLAIDRVAVLV